MDFCYKFCLWLHQILIHHDRLSRLHDGRPGVYAQTVEASTAGDGLKRLRVPATDPSDPQYEAEPRSGSRARSTGWPSLAGFMTAGYCRNTQHFQSLETDYSYY